MKAERKPASLIKALKIKRAAVEIQKKLKTTTKKVTTVEKNTEDIQEKEREHSKKVTKAAKKMGTSDSAAIKKMVDKLSKVLRSSKSNMNSIKMLTKAKAKLIAEEKQQKST